MGSLEEPLFASLMQRSRHPRSQADRAVTERADRRTWTTHEHADRRRRHLGDVPYIHAGIAAERREVLCEEPRLGGERTVRGTVYAGEVVDALAAHYAVVHDAGHVVLHDGADGGPHRAARRVGRRREAAHHRAGLGPAQRGERWDVERCGRSALRAGRIARAEHRHEDGETESVTTPR